MIVHAPLPLGQPSDHSQGTAAADQCRRQSVDQRPESAGRARQEGCAWGQARHGKKAAGNEHTVGLAQDGIDVIESVGEPGFRVAHLYGNGWFRTSLE